MENQSEKNQDFTPQVIGKIRYKFDDKLHDGMVSVISVFGKTVLLLNGPTCENMIINSYDGTSNCNAQVPFKNIYMNLPENLLDLIKKSE